MACWYGVSGTRSYAVSISPLPIAGEVTNRVPDCEKTGTSSRNCSVRHQITDAGATMRRRWKADRNGAKITAHCDKEHTPRICGTPYCAAKISAHSTGNQVLETNAQSAVAARRREASQVWDIFHDDAFRPQLTGNTDEFGEEIIPGIVQLTLTKNAKSLAGGPPMSRSSSPRASPTRRMICLPLNWRMSLRSNAMPEISAMGPGACS